MVRDIRKEILEKLTEIEEKDLNPRMPEIQKYIQDEIIRYEQISKGMVDDRKVDWPVKEKPCF